METQESTEEVKQNLFSIIDLGEGTRTGKHNFIRIVSDNVGPDILNYLNEHGYGILIFSDDKINEISEILLWAQGYMEGYRNIDSKFPPKKVAIIVSPEIVKKIIDAWKLTNQYCYTFIL